MAIYPAMRQKEISFEIGEMPSAKDVISTMVKSSTQSSVSSSFNFRVAA